MKNNAVFGSADIRVIPSVGRGARPFAISGLIAVVVLWSVLSAWAAQPALVQTDFKPPAKIWVGQRVTINVTLSGAGTFAGAPVFDLPTISGALIMKIDDRPVIGTRQVDGLEYTTQTHELAVFPQREGDFNIPPFTVRFGIRPAPDAEPIEYALSTQEIRFNAVMPPGAAGLGSIVSAEKLTVTETWSPEPQAEATVGDAFTRTVTFQAPDIPGMAFPPLPDITIPGLGVYPKPPVVRDKAERGDFFGSRLETIVYVLEKTGTVVIPELVFHWWDIGRQELQSIELPAVTIEAKSAPATNGNQTPAVAASDFYRWSVPLAVILAAIIAVFLKLRPIIVRYIDRRRTRRKESEPACFSRLIRACRRNEPAAALNAFFKWLSKVDDGKTLTIAGFLDKHPDPALSQELDDLQKAAIKVRADWTGKKLSRTLTDVRLKIKHDKRSVAPQALPELNPAK